MAAGFACTLVHSNLASGWGVERRNFRTKLLFLSWGNSRGKRGSRGPPRRRERGRGYCGRMGVGRTGDAVGGVMGGGARNDLRGGREGALAGAPAIGRVW